ncbi:unnamed protein product [Diabrotica balteata]|uniref:Uncharacterized protein n=1 Tax=Diabrotica balteata TaxID=107213 RepID=A0A9N9T820_DIABA|nr:unnamed protein product [Diabrotica balteata]
MEELANTDSQSMLADMRDSPPNENMTSESNLDPPGTQEWVNDDFDSEDPVTSASDKQLPSLLSLKVILPEQINIEESSEVVLPQALEEVLALKSQRQLELDNEIDATNTENQQNQKSSEKEPLWEKDDNVDAVPDAEVTSDKVRKEKEVKDKYSKNKKKKNKKKNRKLKANEEKEDNKKNGEKEVNLENELENVEIEYVQETIGLHELAPQYRQFYSIFESFKISDQKADIAPPTLALPTSLSSKTVAVAEDVDDMDDLEEVS